MIKVYSHPRSGTNYVMALIARNLYPDADLSTPAGVIGHWSDRITVDVNPYGRLAGGHMLYVGQEIGEAVYVHRDGRDVALSVWRTKAMLSPSQRDMMLAQFLRKPLDWVGTPGTKAGEAEKPRTVLEHWRYHLQIWRIAPALRLRYEDALADPQRAVAQVAERFGLKMPRQFAYVAEPVGWYPNEGRAGTWREHFTRSDLAYCYTVAPPGFWGWWQKGEQ